MKFGSKCNSLQACIYSSFFYEHLITVYGHWRWIPNRVALHAIVFKHFQISLVFETWFYSLGREVLALFLYLEFRNCYQPLLFISSFYQSKFFNAFRIAVIKQDSCARTINRESGSY
jgi:hypothetical protein